MSASLPYPALERTTRPGASASPTVAPARRRSGSVSVDRLVRPAFLRTAAPCSSVRAHLDRSVASMPMPTCASALLRRVSQARRKSLPARLLTSRPAHRTRLLGPIARSHRDDAADEVKAPMSRAPGRRQRLPEPRHRPSLYVPASRPTAISSVHAGSSTTWQVPATHSPSRQYGG